jgi:hypothetical protein
VDSDNDRSPSPPANRAYANRHGSRVYETLYHGESPGEGSGSGSRPCSLTSRRLSTIAESPSPERRPPYTPPARPRNPVTRSLAHSSDLESTIDSGAPSPSESVSPGSATQAQNPVETPTLTTQSSTPAWRTEGGQGRSLYLLGPLASTNNVTLRHDISEDIPNHPYLQIGQSASPEARSSAPNSPDLPARSATDDNLRPAQELLSPFGTPSPPSVSGKARSDAISMANGPQLPVQAHIPASTTQNSSPRSGHQPESSFTAQAANTNSKPARYRSTLSTSSISPLSGNHHVTSLSTPNVSPLSGNGPRPVSSTPTVYTSSGSRQLVDRALRIVDSSSTLFYNQGRQTPLVQQQSEVQLELTEALDLTPETIARPKDHSTQPKTDATQPTVTVARLIGDGDPASPRKNAVKANPRPIGMFSPSSQVDERRFRFPRYKFRPWQA